MRQSASMYTYRARRFCAILPAALHVEGVVELIDQANGLAHRLALGDDLVERQIVLDALHAALRGRQLRQNLLEHDLHQPRGAGVGDQSVAAHRAVLGRRLAVSRT